MSDEPKSLFDLLYKTVKSTIPKSKVNFTYGDMGDDDIGDTDAVSARALLQAVGTWAGKGKEEIVQILAKEVGVAVAAMLKEPVTQILENRQLQITLDLVAKDAAQTTTRKKKAKKKTRKKTTASKKR